MIALEKPLSRLSAPSEAIRQFTASWFTATMGTGIVALMLGQLSAFLPVAHPIAVGLWMANMLLFLACSAMFIARAVWFPSAMRLLFLHPSQSMFIGAIPMGLATIVNGFVAFGPALIGPVSFHVAEVLWWIDVVLSVLSGLVIPFLMFTSHDHRVENMSALWLLPIVPAEVAAASAGFLLPHVAIAMQQILLIVGTLLWALSVPAALAVLTILFLRLALHRIPSKELGVSGWLTLGPLGTGSLALVILGQGAKFAVVGTSLESLASVMQGVGIVGGLMLWGYGAWWWSIGIAATLYHARRDLPFNMGWWALTFPLGVYTASTYALAQVLGSHVFLGIAIAFTVLLTVLWSIVALRTLIGGYRGDLFSAPCLISSCTTGVKN